METLPPPPDTARPPAPPPHGEGTPWNDARRDAQTRREYEELHGSDTVDRLIAENPAEWERTLQMFKGHPTRPKATKTIRDVFAGFSTEPNLMEP